MISTGSSISRGSLVESRLLLGIDNSFDFLNLAVSREDALIEERRIKSNAPPSQALPGHVVSILGNHGYVIGDVASIIVATGPGSFTGIRVALAFCKGLSEGKNIPLIGVPTLDILAAPFAFMENHYICPLIDAKKGEVFTSLYRASGNGAMERSAGHQAMKPEEVPRFVKTPCVLFGSGIALCADFLKGLNNVTIIHDGFSRVSGQHLIKEGIKRAQDTTFPGVITPIYGRRSEAEIKFNVTVS